MNVTTTSSTTSTSDVSSTSQSSKTASTQKSSEKSFDEELKTAAKTEENTEAKKDETSSKDVETKKETSANNKVKEENSNEQEDDFINDMISGNVNFTDYKYHSDAQTLLTQNIQDLLNTRNVMSNVVSANLASDYDSMSMSGDDAMFFVNLTKNSSDISMQNIASQVDAALMNSDAEAVQKQVNVSATLMSKLSESMKTNQPFRIDFDKDVSVIIKVNKDGSIAANFIPGDKAVEQYLKNNISFLKQRFDEENLSYSQLSYSNSRQQQRQQQQNKENKEK